MNGDDASDVACVIAIRSAALLSCAGIELRGEAAPAPAGVRRVGVLEYKPFAERAFRDVVDDGAFEVQRALLVDDDLHAAALDLFIELAEGVGGEVEKVAEAGAPAALHADPQAGVGFGEV